MTESKEDDWQYDLIYLRTFSSPSDEQPGEALHMQNSQEVQFTDATFTFYMTMSSDIIGHIMLAPVQFISCKLEL